VGPKSGILLIEINLAAAGRYLSKDDVAFIQKVMMGVNKEMGSFFMVEV
jgi:hypothetical protein